MYRVALRGNDFKCLVCGDGATFTRCDVSLSSGGAGFVGTEMLGPSVEAAICTECGYVHMFEYRKLMWQPE